MTEASDRIIKNVTNTKGSEKHMPEFKDIKLSDECKHFFDNIISFKSRYADRIDADMLTTYTSYIMITDESLDCYKFFINCVDKRKYGTIKSAFEETLYQFTGIHLSEKLEAFGEYLYDPLNVKQYNCSMRDKEISECINVLSRMTKSNVLLVGNSGVGKTSIVYGICNVIQSAECPESLRGKIVYALDTTKVVSGTTYRGDLEKRVDEIVQELKSCPDIILFIDEIHTLFNKSSDDTSSTTLQSMLKPYLTSGARVIGTTTNAEYRIIESDKAFERRFSIVRVGEMSAENTLETMKNKLSDFQSYHHVSISDDVCRYLIQVSDLYIKDRFFPDKAIDVLDIGCVICKNSLSDTVTKEHINSAIENLTSINPNNKSIDSVSDICADIKTRIIGQDKAIDSVCTAFKKYYLGINNKNKPIGNYLFVGPTGTGKTELCVQLAQHFFARDCFIRYDMSEFMEPHSISKIIGSPPGYVGYNKTDTLTEFVKHNPFCIILFDEIEKAHKDVINILLQIMDCGRLTDATGQTVDFCNTLIVMTSNVGCKQYLESNSIGFNTQSKDISTITKYVNQYFSPEFRNRLDDIVIFNPIAGDTFLKIFNMRLSDTINTYAGCGLSVELDRKAREKLAERCYDEVNGVRHIQRNISNIIDRFVLKAAEENKNSVKLSYKNDFTAKIS